MGKYFRIKQGECLSSLAKKYGLPDYHSIYDHPNNQKIKSKRTNPNLLNPGDLIYIPDLEMKTVDGVTEKKHVFMVKKNKVKLRLIIRDENENLLVNLPYKIRIENQELMGTTGEDGKIEEELPSDCAKALLIIFGHDGENSPPLGAIPLRLGCLDPIEEITGIQARLNNLGFNCGKVDGIAGEKTKAALRAFQADHNLPLSGQADAATSDLLRRMHDWQ